MLLDISSRFRRLSVSSLVLLACGRVLAADPILPADLPVLAAVATPTEPASLTPSPQAQNVTILLIRKMVKKGLLTQEEADEMIQAAEEEAAAAQAQTAALQSAVAQVRAEATQFTPDPALMAAGDDAMRVTYIPDSVRQEMREQVKQDVMEQVKNERWALPKLVPEWSMRVRLFGDIRVRYEYDAFPSGNDKSGAFPNFNAINTGAPFDVAGTVFSPQLNVDEDRQRIRLRARVGLEADLGQNFTAGLRIATGDSNTPVSTNQTFGLANGSQGGMFSKYSLYLDRAFLKYELGPKDPERNLTILLGRFDNPFFSTEMIWDEDVGFDGLAFVGKYNIGHGITPFLAGGAFPVFNTDLNFGTNQPDKFKSTDKWLYAIQCGVDVQLKKDWHFKFAGGYYYFDDVQGELSDPFVPLNSSDQGNTDTTRPSFAQKGNSYFPLRRIVPTAANNFGTINQYQYFGLATAYHELALTGRIDYSRWEPYKLSLLGEFAKNLAFDQNDVNRIAVNNRGPDNALGQVGQFEGGDTAWFVEGRFGHATLDKFGKWVIGASYRYIESDAVLDAFTDSDFGMGGTNQQGYTIFGTLALSPRVSFGVRWLSSNEIAGPPLKIDVFQVEVNGRF